MAARRLASVVEQVLYLAAHGGFAGQAVPLGGGAAIANQLEEEWARTRPFRLHTIGPAILGPGAPTARDLVTFNETAYARFCRDFSAAATADVLKADPTRTAVLVNDISEGPDFPRLAQAGFRVFTIWHVDVVAYIADLYLRGWVRPVRLAGWWQWLRRSGLSRLAPTIVRLIFEQQRACLAHSRRVLLPSSGMRGIVQEAYPWVPAERIEVLPWGARPPSLEDEEVARAAASLREEFGVRPQERVLLCLSRISPEKGQDTLLESLRDWDGPPLALFICGEPAFMQGGRHFARLQQLAAGLPRVRTIFPGYVSGLRKAAFFRMAELYVFPSRHESYGLTLMEALAAGLPAVCLDHHGAREVMRPEFGSIAASPQELVASIAHLLAEGPALRRRGEAARLYARQHDFASCAARLANLLHSA
jgi:glycosyltransferase involved in cell wall biosynthesis